MNLKKQPPNLLSSIIMEAVLDMKDLKKEGSDSSGNSDANLLEPNLLRAKLKLLQCAATQ